MQGHGRPNRTRIIQLLALLLFAVNIGWIATASLAEIGPPPVELLDDAELCDVFFIDPERGWAVGDRGAIRHTADGGRHWRLQRCPVTCRLESVFFLDDRNGWIVGGWTQPYTHKGVGVVLRTIDGGERWEPVPRLSLPALRRVKFFDNRRGWATAEASDMYPAGVFHTVDGGLSWSSVPSRGVSRWLSGDALNPQTSIVAGRNGASCTVTPAGLEPSRTPSLGPRSLRCVRFAHMNQAAGGPASTRPASLPPFSWSVGDGGLALLSVDGGRSWHEPIGRIPAEIQQFDFHAVAAHGNSCWIAGVPGTRVLHTADGGHSWQVLATGHALPIRALTFLDDNRGWAVGSLGTILATRDGGRNWTVQRQGGARAAMMGVFAESRSIPMELLASLAGNEGYLSVLDVVTSDGSQEAASTQRSLDIRTHESVVAVGAAVAETAWQFPLRYPSLRMPADALVADWNEVNSYAAQERLVERLVRRVRMWRPDVVVTEPPCLQGDDPLAHLVNQAVITAVEKAADDGFEPEHATLVGLRPWRVKKVYSSLGADAAGAINITTSQLAPRLGCTLADRASRGRRLLDSGYAAPPHTYGFRLMVSRLSDNAGRKDFFSGIPLTVGGDARRAHHAPPPGDLRSLTRLAQQRRNVDKLLNHLAASNQTGPAWLSQIENLVRGLEPGAGGEVLFRVAQNFRDSGRPDLAADVYDLLTRRCAGHDARDASLAWLVQYFASAEAGWAFGKRPQTDDSLATDRNAHGHAPGSSGHAPETGAVRQAVFLEPAGVPTPPMTNKAPYARAGGATSLLDRSQRAALYGQLIQNSRPALFAAPEVRFPLADADRALGRQAEAERYFHFLANGSLGEPWRACAKSELWLSQPARRLPKPVAQCLRTEQRPRLDGALDDDIWNQCMPMPLVSPRGDDASWPAAAMLACDGQFLYLAASCRKTSRTVYSPSAGARPRDPDLKSRDRVQVFIDVDRDYTTFFRLVVDHRGWVSEACTNIQAWNPDWYVAASESDEFWTVEAAIPFAALVETSPNQQDTWAVGIQRIAPDVGIQSWAPTTSSRVTPATFGLLLFR